MIYSDKLKELRTNNNLKQADLAKILDVDRACYGQYEREYVIIPLKHLNLLCAYFEVSIDYIFSLTSTLNYENNSNNISNNLSAQRLKELRKDNKITQKKLADILNTTQSTITGYEVGRYLIATPFLYTICKKYNISADYLLGKIDEPKYLKK